MWDYWHNESINIHTHLWGAAVALVFLAIHILELLDVLPLWLWTSPSMSILHPELPQLSGLPASVARITLGERTRAPDVQDVLGFVLFLVSAAVCLGCSATYHTVACHSHAVARSYNRLDYIGIVVLITGSFVPVLRYAFFCEPYVHAFYAVLIFSLAAVAMNFVVRPVYATPAYRPVRAGVFVLLGISGVLPVVHAVALYGMHFVMQSLGFSYLALSGALYIVGAGIYVARIPERLAPGKFDYIGASHQIFHCFVLIAAVAHYVAVCRGYLFWHSIEVTEGYKATEAMCMVLESLGGRPM